jgi:mRNA interferase RelE/StbE
MVELSTKAQDFYKEANQPLAKKLARCFEQLEKEPRHHGNIKPLQGNLAGSYRYRVGEYRVIYRVIEDEQIVRVLKNRSSQCRLRLSDLPAQPQRDGCLCRTSSRSRI